ncbi:MAG: lysylphosphatidylglycerol synthase domain-containing protein [Stellaceae bacterium]
MKTLKRLSLALALLGVLTATALIGWSGFGRVAASMLSVGYGGFALLCGWQFLVAAVLGTAWRVIAPIAPGRRGLALDGVFIWARLVRDASASCLPFSQLGGFAIGARALSLHGQTWSVASISTIGDLTAEFLAEIVFAAAGLVILAAHRFNWLSTAPWAIGVVLALVVGVGLLSLPQRAAPVLARLGRWILGRGFDLVGENFQTIEPELTRIYRRVDLFAASNAVHFLGWVAKGAGGWIAFRLLGAPISLLDALAIEGLLHAALAFAFLIPGYAGVQEGAYVLLGAAFGVPPEIALGTSLLRRGRDIAIGIPVLLVWQFVELRRLRKPYG